MAQTQVPKPAPAPAKTKKGGGKWLAILAVLVIGLGVVGLMVVRSMAASKAAEALAKEIGPAQKWRVGIGVMAAPRALLGLPFSATVTGREIQTKGKPQIKALDVDAVGLRVSVKRGKLVGAERIGVKAQLGEQAVVQFVRQEAVSSRMFSDVTVQFGVGEILLTGTIRNALLEQLTGQSAIYATAKAKPEIRPPAFLELRVSDVTMRGGEGQLRVPTSMVSSAIARDLRFDLQKLLPGITVQTVSITDGALAIDGTIDAAALTGAGKAGGGGGKGGNPGTPALPDPKPGVQS